MKVKYFLLTIIIILLVNCKKELNEKSFDGEAPKGLVHWNVGKVEGPNNGFVNQVVILDVYYPTSSGCDYVSQFVSDKSNGNIILIKAYGGTVENALCTMAAVPKIINYEFIPLKKGKYVLKFINRNGTKIIHHLTIN